MQQGVVSSDVSHHGRCAAGE